MSFFYRLFGSVLVFLSVIGAAALGLAIGDRTPPISYDGARALSASAPAGGYIEVEYKVYRDRICPASVRRYLVDSSGTKHSIPSFTVGLGIFVGHEIYKRQIQIPQNASIGPAEYQVTIEYYCNIIHRMGWPIVVETPIVQFNITPAESPITFGLPSEPDG